MGFIHQIKIYLRKAKNKTRVNYLSKLDQNPIEKIKLIYVLKRKLKNYNKCTN